MRAPTTVRVAAVVLAATALAGVAGPGPAGADAPRGRDGASPTVPYPVGVRTKTFVDRGRVTPADVPAGITPSDRRRLETTIYYPARRSVAADGAPVPDAQPARGRRPLVLFSPGSPGTPADYEVLLADWAAHGYVVAALTFPVSSVAGPDAVAWRDLPAQSEDARFALGKVLRLDAARARIPEIDEDRIAVAGHSFGGATALSLVAKCCRDRRVDAAVALAAVTETVRGPKLRDVRGPVLFVHARGDRAVSYAEMREACLAAGKPKRLLTVEQVRGLRAHVTPYLGETDDWSPIVRPAIVDFLDGHLRDERDARRRLEDAGRGTTIAAVSRCRPGDAVEEHAA